MEYSGLATGSDEVVFSAVTRRAVSSSAFWLRDHRVIAGDERPTCGMSTKQVQALIRSRQDVTESALVDPDTPLDSLLSDNEST